MILHNYPFSSLSLLPFLLLWVVYFVVSSSYSCFTPSIVFCSLLFCVLRLLTYVILIIILLFAFWGLSHLIVLTVVLFVLIRGLSRFMFLPPPGARTWTKTLERTLIALCLPVCFFAKLSFQTSLFVFFLMWVRSVHQTCLFHCLGRSFQGVGDFL